MKDEKIIEQAVAYIQKLFRTNAGGHDVDHTMRVYRNALLIAEKEQDCDRLITALAALLHDADDHKLFGTKENANARTFLLENQVPQQMADRICEAINTVSFSQNKGRIPLKLKSLMNTETGRMMAEKRHAFLEMFLEEYLEEVGGHCRTEG